MVELLGPEQARVALARDGALVVAALGGQARLVEGVGFGFALIENGVEVGEGSACLGVGGAEAEAQDDFFSRRDGEAVEGGALGAGPFGAQDVASAVDHVVVKGVLGMRGTRLGGEHSARVRLVVGQQKLGPAVGTVVGVETKTTERLVLGEEAAVDDLDVGARAVALTAAAPRPVVSKPALTEDGDRGGLGAAIDDTDPDQDVVGGGLGVLRGDVEVAVLVKDAGVEQLVLEIALGPAAGLLDELAVGVALLRVLVERFEVGARGGGIEVVVELLDVLAVVALRAREAEQTLLEDGVDAVVEREREAQPALAVADPEQAVLAPAVHPTARVLVGEVAPGAALGRVVFAHGAPLPLGKVGTPALPVGVTAPVRGQPLRFGARAHGSS